MRIGFIIAAFAFWIAAWAVNEWLVRQNPSNPLLRRLFRLAVPVLFGVTILVLWEGMVRGFNVPFVLLPPPSAIWARIVSSLPTLWADFRQTFLKAVLIGYALGCGSGFLAAIAIDRSPFLQRGLLPRYSVPNRVVAVEALVRTSVGKYDKKVLRQRYTG